MGDSGGPISKLYETEAGYSQRDLQGILEYYGYQLDRHARHGALYVHPELRGHPDRTVRMTYARVLVPKGQDLPRYAARDVKASVEALLAYREETGDES